MVINYFGLGANSPVELIFKMDWPRIRLNTNKFGIFRSTKTHKNITRFCLFLFLQVVFFLLQFRITRWIFIVKMKSEYIRKKFRWTCVCKSSLRVSTLYIVNRCHTLILSHLVYFENVMLNMGVNKERHILISKINPSTLEMLRSLKIPILSYVPP